MSSPRSLMLLLLSLFLGVLGAHASEGDRPGAQRERRLTHIANAMYRVLSTLPLSERYMVYSTVSGEIKAAVWRVHLGVVVASHPELTSTQRDFFNEVSAILAEPGASQRFDGLKTDEALEFEKYITTIDEVRASLLSRDLAHEAFRVLGPLPEPRVATSPYRALPGPDSGITCECSISSDYCTRGTCFQDFEGVCTWTAYGCGTLLLYACTGMCLEP